ncbi:hypothetical protein Tco_0032170 [Tanacetum coccineum]
MMGVFQVNPLECVNFDNKVIDDVSFDGMSFKIFFATIRRLVLVSPTSMYYKIPSALLIALKLLKSDEELYDVAHVVEQIEHEDESNVNIPRMTTDDPWLNKLVDSKFKAKKNVSCSSFNPDTPWNECKLVLGMRFESPQQLKRMLANYGVQHGYQLWYMQNDHNKLLVFYGMDVSEGKCAAFKGKKPKIVDNEECETSKHGSKKGDGRKAVNEIISKGKAVCIEHYNKLWQYRKSIIDINPGFTCELETEVNDDDGKLYFKRFYVCFHSMKQGWLEGCRKIISLDGCFLTHTYKGQILIAMGRDANNQMFPIAWAVVGV